ncbi:translocation/assembly module TamB domain-containing protein [Shimia sp.]|uniref:translocation/assembly module TamB domain-containing protein n=1 Tax=Shimia sp. TaxID=1954381 RepID=UPI00329765CA
MRWFAIIILVLMPLSAFAEEEEDKGRLTRFLESSLSGAGRVVEVNGLRGALSSEATIEEIKISDEDGLWLSLSKITLNWNRLSVLKGNIVVNQLSAEKIAIPRLPKTEPTPETPSAAATPFSLPELPVSIDIQKLSADRIELGEPLLGQPINLSLNAKLVLLEGNGEVILEATRLEGPKGIFDLDAAYSNETGQLRVDLKANEAENGIITKLIQLPGSPAIDLSVQGMGPVDDFTAEIRLASAGQERLAGQVVLSTEPSENPETPPTRVVSADISGDMAPLFAPEYRDFFGQNIALTTLLHSFPDGRITLDDLSLTSAALDLHGEVALASGGLPDSFDIKLRMADPEGDAILLPISGGKTLIDRANLTADYDAAQGERWTLSGTVEGFKSDAADLGWVSLAGNGLIRQQSPRQVSASLTLDMDRLRLSDPALAQAVGETGKFSGDLLWHEEQGLELTGFDLNAGGLDVTGDAQLTGLGSDTTVEGNVNLQAADITRFSGLANRDLTGAILADVSGSFAALTGAFDVDMKAQAQDLTIADPRFDALAKGKTTLAVSAKRDFDGIDLRNAELHADGFDITSSGKLKGENGDAVLSATLNDSSIILDSLSGPTTIDGTAKLTEGDWVFGVDATAPGQIVAEVTGALPKDAPADASFDLAVGSVQTFLPSLPGAAHVQADARQLDAGWKVDLDATGPFDTRAKGSGIIDPEGGKNSFDLSGSVPLALANQALAPNSVQGTATYDLSFAGPPELKSLSGTIQTNGARFALPSLRAALSEINSTITLNNGTAGVAVTSNFSGGGQIGVDGSVNLSAPFNANLPIRLTNLTYRDGQLYETSVDGAIQFTGPLTGGGNISGDLTLGQTNIRISSSALAGVGGVPEIAHVGEPSKVRRTRQHAGLIKEATSSSSKSKPFGLDLKIQTGQRISVRGMGLNADFDGGVRLQGDTDNVVTQGELSLIRGRMDFLTKTFDIDEGLVRMEGDLVPWMRVLVTSEQPDATVRIILEGRLDDPSIILESDPELPEDEVLSQLLFGRDLSSISGLQAAQLAASLAALSGNGPGRPRLGRNTGLDELALTFDESGTPGVRAGKYINENIYTEFGVDSEGKSTIGLNLDVSDNLTVKGTVESNSDTGIGLFFQRDY